jgi:hypothetical protein
MWIAAASFIRSTGVEGKPGAAFRRRFDHPRASFSSIIQVLKGMLAPRKTKLQEWQRIQ